MLDDDLVFALRVADDCSEGRGLSRDGKAGEVCQAVLPENVRRILAVGVVADSGGIKDPCAGAQRADGLIIALAALLKNEAAAADGLPRLRQAVEPKERGHAVQADNGQALLQFRPPPLQMPDARQIFFHHLGIIPVSAADVAALEDRRLDAAPVKLFAGGEHHGIDNVEPDDARHRAGLDLAVHGDDRVAMGARGCRCKCRRGRTGGGPHDHGSGRQNSLKK